MVRTINSALENRAESLDSIVTAYNYTPKATIDEDTPSKHFFGRELKTQLEIYEPKSEAAETTACQRAFQQQYSRNGARERSLAVGEEFTAELAIKRRVPAKVVSFQGKAESGSDTTIMPGGDNERLEDFTEDTAEVTGEPDAPPADVQEPPGADTVIEPGSSTRRPQPPRACKDRQSFRDYFSWR